MRDVGAGNETQIPLLKHPNNEVSVWRNGIGFRSRWEKGTTSKPIGRGRLYNNGGLTWFFFTNFPDNYGLEQMWKIFLKWGDVRDVYIPPRRDKKGLRFGFVKFKDVLILKALEEKLASIKIGDIRLEVNIPMFDRNNNRAVDMGQQRRSVPGMVTNNFRNGSSYAKVVKEGGLNEYKQKHDYRGGQIGGRAVRTKDNEWKGLTFNVAEDDLGWLKGCYVAKTFNPEGVFSLQNKLQMEGVFSISTTPMGGNMVLLQPKEDGSIENLLGDDTSCLPNWF